MVISVIERCMHDSSGDDYSGTRTYKYEIEEAQSLEEAVKIFADSFDIDKVFDCDDSFEGDCLDSYTESISIYEK